MSINQIIEENQTHRILNFGSDYLAVAFKFRSYGEDNLFTLWLEHLFRDSTFDCDNSNMIWSEPFFGSVFTFNLLKIDAKKGEKIIQFLTASGVPVFSIRQNSARHNLSPYCYRVDFYGQFFHLNRIGEFDSPAFLILFEKNLDGVKYTITRLDVCTDFEGFTTNDIKSMCDTSRKVVFTGIGFNPDTGIPESYYYGKKNNVKEINIYNKKVELLKHRKERFFSDYFNYQLVTRFELRLFSGLLKRVVASIHDCFDVERLYYFYFAILDEPCSTWLFLEEIKNFVSANINGEVIYLPRGNNQMEKEKYIRRWINYTKRLRDIYNLTIDDLKDILIHEG